MAVNTSASCDTINIMQIDHLFCFFFFKYNWKSKKKETWKAISTNIAKTITYLMHYTQTCMYVQLVMLSQIKSIYYVNISYDILILYIF